MLALTLPSPYQREGDREYCENNACTAGPAGGDIGCRRWLGGGWWVRLSLAMQSGSAR